MSNDGDVSGYQGQGDMWVVKLSSTGTIEWQKALGGSAWDEARSVRQTNDGGYIVAGLTLSNDGDVSGNHGLQDFWVVKLNGNGAIQWQKCLGGSADDRAKAIQQTSDGGYIVVGYADSSDGDLMGHPYGTDYWVVKLTGSGNIEWQKSFGGSGTDFAYAVQQTSDGGFVIAGATTSNNGNVSNNNGSWDYWVIKLSANGSLQWQKCLGGSDWDDARSVSETSDGGFVLAGWSGSNDGDVSGNHGNWDFWVVKLASNEVGMEEETTARFSIAPNPSSGQIAISFEHHTSPSFLACTDASGRIVLKQNLLGVTGPVVVDLGSQETGLYTLQVVFQDGSHWVERLVRD